VSNAAKLLAKNGYAALPVVDEGGALAGIVTEADVIASRFPAPGSLAGVDPSATAGPPRTVGEVMSTPVVGVSQDADVAVVAREMVAHRRRCVPIIAGSTLVGVITRRDLVKVLARSDKSIAMDVRTHLKYLGGPGRWAVQVSDGEVVLTDEYGKSGDHPIAIALADAVPGVISVSVRSQADGSVEDGSSAEVPAVDTQSRGG
jgi:CBS domain-containing protein